MHALVFAPLLPKRTEAVFVGHGTLDDQGLKALWVREHEPKAHRTPIVLQVERTALETERLGEMLHHLGEVIECVGESPGIVRVAVTEAGVVRRHEVELAGEPGQERLVHARG